MVLGGWAHPRPVEFAEALSGYFSCEVSALSPHDLDSDAGVSYSDALSTHLLTLPKPRFLIAWSLGAMIALEVACADAEILDGLVLHSATARFSKSADYEMGVASEVLSKRELGIQVDIERELRAFFQEVSYPERIKRRELGYIIEGSTAFGIGSLQRGLEYFKQFDIRPELEALEIPLLLIHGEQDAVVPFEAGEYVAKLVRGSRLIGLKGVGHRILLNGSEILNPSIEFLRSL
jgi:pimeloyl-[acyl-carrier protein] methyl ester esterase